MLRINWGFWFIKSLPSSIFGSFTEVTNGFAVKLMLLCLNFIEVFPNNGMISLEADLKEGKNFVLIFLILFTAILSLISEKAASVYKSASCVFPLSSFIDNSNGL